MRLHHAVVSSLMFLAACSGNTGGELKVDLVADTAATNAGLVVRNLGCSLDAFNQVPSLGDALDQIFGGGTSYSPPVPGTPGLPGEPAPPSPTQTALRLATSSLTAVSPAQGGVTNPASSALQWVAARAVTGTAGTTTSTEEAATDVERFLRERVFTEANHESSSSGRITFFLHGAMICTDGTYEPDPACVQEVDDLEIRVRASLSPGGMDFTLMVGPLWSELATLTLGDGTFSARFDLGALRQAVEHIATVTGATVDLPAVMAGVFELGLARTGTNEFEVFANVPSAIQVNTDVAEGRVDFTTAAASPLFSLGANCDTGGVGAVIGLGRTIVSAPYSSFVTTAVPDFRTLTLDLGGLEARISGTGGSDVATFTDVGFGATTTTVYADGTLLLAADLNARSGRHFDMTVAPEPTTGLASFAFGGPVDATIQLHLAPLASNTAIEPGTEDETYTVALEGSAPILREVPPLCITERYCIDPFDPFSCFEFRSCMSGPSFEVVSGTFTLDTTSQLLADPIMVPAGQCLWSDGAGEHPVLGSLYAAACP